MTVNCFGDSISAGYGVTTAQRFPNLIAAELGISINNTSISGDLSFEQTPFVHAAALASGDWSILHVGGNDMIAYNTDATKRGYFIRGISALAVFLATPNKVKATDPSVVYTGSWTTNPTGGYTFTKYTQAVGATATFQVNGTAVYVASSQQDGFPGSFRVEIDGIDKGVFTRGTVGLQGYAAIAYGPMVVAFRGLSAGQHTVKFTAVSGFVPLLWVAGNDQTYQTKVFVGNIIKAAAYGVGGSDAAVIAFNADLAAAITAFKDDGLDIHLVNCCDALNYQTDMLTGDATALYHPNPGGHVKLANAYLASIEGEEPEEPGLTYVSVATFKGSDGNYYIDEGENRKKLVVE